MYIYKRDRERESGRRGCGWFFGWFLGGGGILWGDTRGHRLKFHGYTNGGVKVGNTYAYYLLITYYLAYAIDDERNDHSAEYQAKHNHNDDHMLRLASRLALQKTRYFRFNCHFNCIIKLPSRWPRLESK